MTVDNKRVSPGGWGLDPQKEPDKLYLGVGKNRAGSGSGFGISIEEILGQ